MQEYANTAFGVGTIKSLGCRLLFRKLRQHHFAISQEALRPYFPADHVISGMFVIVNKLFAIDIEQVKGVDCWHPDVRFYHIYKDGQLIGKFYLDIYARENKRGGA